MSQRTPLLSSILPISPIAPARRAGFKVAPGHRVVVAWGVLVGAACAPPKLADVNHAETDTEAAPEEGSESGTTGSENLTGSTSEGDVSSETGSPFIPPTETGIVPDCDVWVQDCPAGEKCMPWANDGGNAWNSARCTPLSATPDSVGDECTVEGSGVSGVDSCEQSAMCWNTDEQGVGTCVAFCQGSEAAPTCTSPAQECSITNDGVLILCLDKCDPLRQDCAGEGEACYPVQADRFACSVDASGPDGAHGDPCAYLNICDPGLFCAAPGAVPGCTTTDGCCNAFCDMTAADPAAACAGPGQECLPWFDEDDATAPPDLRHVGACALP